MKNSADLIQNLRENTDTLSYFMLGYLYEMGELLPRDLDKAAEFYNKAANNKVSHLDKVAIKYKIMAHYNSLILQANRHSTDDTMDLAWLSEAELYDHAGNINRVHPKMIDGQSIIARHYPLTKKEIDSWLKKPKGPQ